MGQKIFHQFQRPVISFDENERLLGVCKPGKGAGFDEATFSGQNITITHLQSGIEKTNLDGISKSEKTAIIYSKQGSVIHLDEPVVLPIAFSENPSDFRTDVIIGTHVYTETPGGSTMVFSVIKGPIDDWEPNPLTNPLTQVILGYVQVQAGVTDHSTSTFIPVRPVAAGSVHLFDEESPLSEDINESGITITYDAAKNLYRLALQAQGVTEGRLADGAVTTNKIADDAVTTAKLADGAVTATKLAANSVGASRLIDESVIESKLAAEAVTAAKIGSLAVTTAKIANDGVTTAKIGPYATSAISSSSFITGGSVYRTAAGACQFAGILNVPTGPSLPTNLGTIANTSHRPIANMSVLIGAANITITTAGVMTLVTASNNTDYDLSAISFINGN